MAGVTLGTGALAIADWLRTGTGTSTADSNTNGYDGFKAMIKGVYGGDYKLVCTPATAAPSAAALANAAISYTVVVSLETADGERHVGYNGPVKLAIADDDTPNATISPTAGAQYMTDGAITVTVTLPKGTWTEGKVATLTVSDPDNTGFGGWTATDATFVATVAA